MQFATRQTCMSQTSECWWCIDGEPGWEHAEIYLNYETRLNFLWEALQELWLDYSQSVCPRTKMRHVPQGTPYPGLIDP